MTLMSHVPHFRGWRQGRDRQPLPPPLEPEARSALGETKWMVGLTQGGSSLRGGGICWGLQGQPQPLPLSTARPPGSHWLSRSPPSPSLPSSPLPSLPPSGAVWASMAAASRGCSEASQSDGVLGTVPAGLFRPINDSQATWVGDPVITLLSREMDSQN